MAKNPNPAAPNDLGERQLKELEDIKASTQLANATRLKEDADIKDITRARSTRPSVVTLGDVRDEIKRGNEAMKKALPRSQGTGGLEELTQRAQADRGLNSTAILKKLGGITDLKSELDLGGSRNETLTAKNQETFQKFIAETKNRSELLSEANQEQVEIFKKIESTLIALQEAGTDDSLKLRQDLNKLAGAFKETAASASKKRLEGIITNARLGTDVGIRGSQGNISDALAALLGRRQVLKPGFEYDSRIRNKDGTAGIRNTQTGRLASASQGARGRVAGFGAILGNFIGNKVEQGIEGKRSERVQSFLDNFRSTRRLDQSAFLAGRRDELRGRLDQLPTQAKPEARAQSTAQIIPFPGTTVPADTTPDSGTLRSDVKYRAFDEAKPEDDRFSASPLDVGDLLDIDPGRRGGKTKGKPKAKVPGAGRLLSAPAIMGAGTALVGGLALQSGLEYGSEKLLEATGTDARAITPEMQAQDEANWQKAGFLEKAQSAVPRGIEKVGDFFGFESLSNAARRERIASETQYLQNKVQPVPRAPQQTSGPAVTTASVNNVQARMDANKPQLIVAPAPAAPAQPPMYQINNNLPRGRVRPEESHLERYQARTSGSFIY